jgi:hypothetical protein
MINIFTLDGKINLKKETLEKLTEISPKIKQMVETSPENTYILDDCLQNELVSVVIYTISKKLLKNTSESLLFLNDTCEKFGIKITTLNLSCDLLLLYLSQIYTKPNTNSPIIKVAKTKISISDINQNYFEKIQDKLLLKINSHQYICVIQKVEINHSYLLSDTDYHVIKHKYKPSVITEQFENQFADLFIKALKYPPMYFDKIMECVNIH